MLSPSTSSSTSRGDYENTDVSDWLDPDWWQSFGGTYYDGAEAVEPTSDGGYIIVGYTQPNGLVEPKLWLIKTNSTGHEEWNRTYGGEFDEFGQDIIQSSDGGYIILASTYSFGAGRMDIWILKTDSSGNEEWNRTFGGTEDDFCHSFLQASDGGYILAVIAQTGSLRGNDGVLLKIDSSGNEMWRRDIAKNQSAGLKWISSCNDGGYIITGYTYEFGNRSKGPHNRTYNNIWLMKTDGNGIEEWNSTFGNNWTEEGHFVIQTADGGYIVAGQRTLQTGAGVNGWLIKTDSKGEEEWNRSYGSTSFDSFHSISQMQDGSYYVVGTTESFGAGQSDVWVMKVDSKGNEEWNKTFGGYMKEEGLSIRPTMDGGFIVLGKTESFSKGMTDIILLKIDADGSGNARNKNPTCFINAPLDGSTVSDIVTLRGNAFDMDGYWDFDDDVEKVEVRIDDGAWEEASFHWRFNRWTYNWDTYKSGNGKHTVTVRSFDGELYSNNENDSIEVIVKNSGSGPGILDDLDAREMFIILDLLIIIIVVVIVLVIFIKLKKMKEIRNKRK